METRRLGKTDIVTSRLGFGAARLVKLETAPDPDADVDGATQIQATHILNTLLDEGINFIDTAAFYLNNEEMIGQAIAHRRDEYWLATKAPNASSSSGPDWSRESIVASIDTSLKRLKTEYLDLIQLHGCDKTVIQDGGAIEALLDARDSGKARYIGYSGDGEDAIAAIETGLFDTLQTSFNIVDQAGLADVIPAARNARMGIIAKRPIANGVFASPAPPYRYADEYWKRSRTIHVPPGAPSDLTELALRFTLSFDEIDVAILGTRNVDHALDGIKWATMGPLSPDLISALREQFAEHGKSWKQR